LKTKLITTDKASVLIVELIDGGNDFETETHIDGEITFNYWVENDQINVETPKCNWSILGMLHALTDEQKGRVVDEFYLLELTGFKTIYFPDYISRNNKKKDVNGQQFNSKTKLIDKSFTSLLQANEVYLSNPYGEKPNCDCYTEYDREGCPDKCWQWINAENKVFRNGLVLISEIKK